MPRIKKPRRRYGVVRVTLGNLRLRATGKVVTPALPYSAPVPYAAPKKYGGD